MLIRNLINIQGPVVPIRPWHTAGLGPSIHTAPPAAKCLVATAEHRREQRTCSHSQPGQQAGTKGPGDPGLSHLREAGSLQAGIDPRITAWLGREVLERVSALFWGPAGHCWGLARPAPRAQPCRKMKSLCSSQSRSYKGSLVTVFSARLLVAEAWRTSDNEAATVCFGPGQSCAARSQRDESLLGSPASAGRRRAW